MFAVMDERKKASTNLLLLVLMLSGFCSVSATPPAKLVSGFVSTALSTILKRLWSMTYTPKTVISGRPMMKFENGYTVETVFDGSKLGIEPFSVEVLPGGELLVLDSMNSNIYRISLPLSRYSRPKLVAGSTEGYSGHVDGRTWEARMNHPKGLTVDDRGNIYVADSLNMAIRKVSDMGVTTIAGGKWNRGGHMDGPSEDAKFSVDFEVVYIGSSCSLLVVDRGNQAIREIQLHFDDCAYQYETSFPLGMAILLAAGFFGYMLALLQRRVGVMVSSQYATVSIKASVPPFQNPIWGSVRPPLVPTEIDSKKQDEEEGFLTSIEKLLSGAKSSLTEIFGAFFSRKTQTSQHQVAYRQQHQPNSWSVQESFIIPDEDEPPPIEAKTLNRKTYAFMSKNQAKIHHLRQGHAYSNHWDGKMQQHHSQHQQQMHQHQQYSSGPQTYYEQSCEATNEIVFGAVQELDSKRSTVEIRAVNHGDTFYGQNGLRSRVGYNAYSNGY